MKIMKISNEDAVLIKNLSVEGLGRTKAVE